MSEKTRKQEKAESRRKYHCYVSTAFAETQKQTVQLSRVPHATSCDTGMSGVSADYSDLLAAGGK